jgi:Tol biopolymer transport system component
MTRISKDKMMWKTSQLFIVLGLAAGLLAQEPVRQELVRQQQQTGLTLASFYRDLTTVNFSDRSDEEKKMQLSSGLPVEGAVSRDGEYVALSLSFDHPYRTYLGITLRDGSALKEYPDVVSPSDMCWSFDRSKIALNAALRRQIHGELLIVELESKGTQEIEAGAHVTSQCWSPDGKRFVYGIGDSIRIYDLGEKKWREIAKGFYPTWSPDGAWISFHSRDAYYVIRPSGAEEKQLFKQTDVRSGLWWSPDGGVVAYVSRGGEYPSHKGLIDFSPRQLRVRRLADNSDDWILVEPDVDYVPSYQWVLPPNLKSK